MKNICPITYEPCGNSKYSLKGLRMLSPKLTELNTLPYSAEKQRNESQIRAGKMSIQGVQPKLSARLDIKNQIFTILHQNGKYILKPQHREFPCLPENEAITMKLASLANIKVPVHGLIYCKDGSFTYFVKRFDREGHNRKVQLEDFAQLAGRRRDTKYNSSLEECASLLNYCTFPVVEKAVFFKRCIFNFLIGNEDMHLKNFSLITKNNIVSLSPAYDYLNTTIAYLSLGKPLKKIEESALPLKGKRRKLTREIWIDYFGYERLEIKKKIIQDNLTIFSSLLPEWKKLLKKSFLTEELKKYYLQLLEKRAKILSIQ